DFIVDVIINQKRDAVAVFAGKPVDQYYEGVKLAREHYRSVHAQNPEVVVVNAYAKHNEAFIGVSGGYHHLPESGGTLVLISNNLCSDVTHYLSGSFGNHMGGPNHRPASSPGRRIKKMIVQTPYLHRAGVGEAVPPEAIIWAKTWEEVVAMLQVDYPQGAKVAVVPDVTIQYFA
ncbi:MAG: hypothetical protein Q7O66_23365, partial [Dehalococcoidia bacterium]|nr:hypothetical protein [Dehalococcoidia bacterium]